MGALHATLHELHETLAQSPTLSVEDRQMLETVLVDIRQALERPVAASPAGHGDTLETAAVRLEAGHPKLAVALRNVLDALGKAGI